MRFKLWGQLELDEDEQAIVSRYQFDDAVLIDVFQPQLIRNAILVGLVATGLIFFLLDKPLGSVLTGLLGVLAGVGAGFWYFNEKRETIYVRDLVHGQREGSVDATRERRSQGASFRS